MTDSIATFQWAQLARRQKIYIVGALALIVAGIGCGLYDRHQLNAEIKVFERQAIEAEREKQAALEKVSKIVTQIKVREQELEKVEVKKNEKRGEVKSIQDQVARDRAEYERAVRERVPGVPSTEQLCADLAAVGHACYPR